MIFAVVFLNGCATYASINNQSRDNSALEVEYSLKKTVSSNQSDDITLVLAFSGGGTRAAALSYGVLQALRETEVSTAGEAQRLIDKVDLISSVSGGSFTAAYYGLYGEKMFSDFEQNFLQYSLYS